MTTYDGTAGQLEKNTTLTNLLLNNSEENSQEIQRRNQTAPGYKLQTSSKASVANIPYVTNNTAGFSKNGQITGRRSVPIPMAKSQRFQSGFQPSDRVYNPPGWTYNSRTATKPSFETSRGKNWCAYVHTRLSPTVVIDSTYVPIVTDPCYWSREGCYKRYQMMSRPTYKIKHKISTSLEWRCCPGYVGPQCQPNESATQSQQSDRRAEVHSDEKAAEGTAPDESQQATEPGIKSKMDYEDMNQEKEITFFLKKVNGISMDIDTMKKIISSLEEKVNEKGDDLPSVMKALKTKVIQDTLREIVQEEMKSFQSIIQESISKILKDLSTVSEENEAINFSLKQFNQTIIALDESQSPINAINTHMVNDIQNMKDQLDSVQKDISIIQINITNELNDIDNSLKDKLAFERQEGRIFANTLNRTLSQSRAIHGQPFEGESITGPTVPDNKPNETHNLREQIILLGDTVRHQTVVNLQLQQDMLMQELRIQNFTNSIGQQRQQAEEASVALVQQCKQDLLQEMSEIKDSIRIVNQTLSDKVEPMDDMMTAIEEKISHISYDLEELKPIKEHNSCADVRHQEEHADKLSAVEAQVDGLAAAMNIFNISINDLQKAQKDLRNHMKDKEEEVERKLNVCQSGIEDALNDTMTVINKAIDSVNDNRYVLENKLEKTNQQLDEIYDFTRKMKMQNSNLIHQIHFLNSTVLALQQNMENFDDLSLFDRLLESAKDSNAISKLENLTCLPQELKKALSKLEEHQSIIDSLQGSQRNYSTDFQEQKLLLEHIETRINSLNYTLMPAAKPKKKVPVEMGLAWKYKDLNRRVQELTIIMFNLTEEVLWLKDSDQNNVNLFRNVSILIEQKVSSQIPHQHINFTLLQKKLNGLVKRESLDLCESFLLDPTAYLNCILAGIFQDISGLQRYAKELDEWLDGSNAQNGSSVSSGRSLRNTDNIVARESQRCNLSPCANGGTCIDTQSGYVCACRTPFGGSNCTVKLVDTSASQDFSKGSYRYAPMVTFFVAHTYGMSTPGPIRFNHMYVNYGASYSPGSGKFNIPYLGVYVFKYTIEYTSPGISGYLVEDGVDKLAFRSGDSAGLNSGSKIITGDAVLELNYGQQVWLRLETGSIPVRFPPVSTFGGYLLYRT